MAVNYGEDCSATQHLNDVEFCRLTEEKNPPLYDRSGKTSRKELIRKAVKKEKAKIYEAKKIKSVNKR